jgi:hypothetical protein
MSVLCCFGHFDNTFYPGNGTIKKECRQCGRVKTIKIKNVQEAIDHFKNYDRAIWFCQKNPVTYETNG